MVQGAGGWLVLGRADGPLATHLLPPVGDPQPALRELDTLRDSPLAGRALVAAGPWALLAAPGLASSSAHLVANLWPGFLPSWDGRRAVLLEPSYGSPLRPWSLRFDPVALGAIEERSTAHWRIWTLPPATATVQQALSSTAAALRAPVTGQGSGAASGFVGGQGPDR